MFWKEDDLHGAFAWIRERVGTPEEALALGAAFVIFNDDWVEASTNGLGSFRAYLEEPPDECAASLRDQYPDWQDRDDEYLYQNVAIQRAMWAARDALKRYADESPVHLYRGRSGSLESVHWLSEQIMQWAMRSSGQDN